MFVVAAAMAVIAFLITDWSRNRALPKDDLDDLPVPYGAETASSNSPKPMPVEAAKSGSGERD